MTADLVTFLRTCLDEDERVARAAVPGPWEWGIPDPQYWRQGAASEDLLRGDGGRHVLMTSKAGAVLVGDADHIARWDPARVLAEVAAKRRIIDECTAATRPALDGYRGPAAVGRLCDQMLLTLAQPYCGRPGWDERWRA